MQIYVRFEGFEPTPPVKKAVDAALREIRHLTAPNSSVVGRVEFDGTEYGCTIDVFWSTSSQYVFVTHEDISLAVTGATYQMMAKLKEAQPPLPWVPIPGESRTHYQTIHSVL